MAKSKESLKKATALKLKLKHSAALAEQTRQEHEQAAQAAAELESHLAEAHAQDLLEEYADLANVQSAKKSLWKRCVDWFNG